MDGQGAVLGFRAPSFRLQDQLGLVWTLEKAIETCAALFIFYPGDFKPVCTSQLCNYSEALGDFERLKVRLLGVSHNTPSSHDKFAKEYGLTFPLLSDPDEAVAKAYGCTSKLMLGGVSRAVFIIGPTGVVLYRYVEPTVLTKRKASELIGILEDLKSNGLI